MNVFQATCPVVPQQPLQLVAVPLGHVPPPALLQLGQELLQGGGAVAVPAGRVARAPLHDLLLQDLLDPTEENEENVLVNEHRQNTPALLS